MNEIFQFGTVFRFNGKEYVWILEISDRIYAFRILETEHSRQLCAMAESKAKGGSIDKPIYSFVVLSTSEVKGRVALCGSPPDYDQIGYKIERICDLEGSDLEELVGEIFSSKHVPDIIKRELKLLLVEEGLRGQGD